MSRRGVSVRDLGPLDCQGWLLRRKEGRRFLGSRWVRYWFVLKKSSLYWYSSKTAPKAEGFLLLSGFTIEQAKPGRKKHVITASHPLIVTLFIAAESFIEMNKWISKLSEAADPCEEINAEGCYSEGSDQDADEPFFTSSSANSERQQDESEDGDSALSGDHRRSSNSEGGGLGGSRRRDEAPPPPDVPPPDGAAGGLPPLVLHVSDETQEEVVLATPTDGVESLHLHHHHHIGPSSGRDFRASFARRCQDDRVNEELHLLRILSSTLKAKELELLQVEQVEQILAEPKLAAPEYRKWRRSNGSLLQEIAQRAAAAEQT